MTKLKAYQQAQARNPREASHLLFEWLSDDEARADLYRSLLNQHTVLAFQSRADVKESVTDTTPTQYRQTAYLITARDHVEQAFRSSRSEFSNSPFQALGSGNFMLGVDAGNNHDQQRAFAQAYLRISSETIAALCTVSFMAAAVLPLKTRNFDLVELAEQAALRFIGFLFGFAQADQALLEPCLRKVSHGLDYQMYGRHFVTDPAALPDNSAAMAAIAKRTADLIDLYQQRIGTQQKDDYQALEDELAELRNFEAHKNVFPLKTFTPILRRITANTIADHPPYSTTELAVIVGGLIAGTVSNVQSSVAIVIHQLFRSGSAVWNRAHEVAVKVWEQQGNNAGANTAFEPFVWEALRLNPPAAFLPRKTTQDIRFAPGGAVDIPQGSIVLIGVGGATRDLAASQHPDAFDETRRPYHPLIFGGDPNDASFIHQCLGQHLAMPLITHVTRQVMLLPGLAETLDPRSSERFGLQKLWGYNCLSYPLEYKRSGLLKQSPLHVIMTVKTPLTEHAEALKRVIKYGAPRIEKKLVEAKHVHFAGFYFLENDSKLALFTVYDRDFESYIEHFALQIGPLFDRIFEHIQDAPPLPVNEFPKEFVDTIRRFNRQPAGNYFFSAYPQVEVAMIQQAFTKATP